MNVTIPPTLLAAFEEAASRQGLPPRTIAVGLIRAWVQAEHLATTGDVWGVAFAAQGELPAKPAVLYI